MAVKKELVITSAVITIAIAALLLWLAYQDEKRVREELEKERDYSRELELQNLKLMKAALSKDENVPKIIVDQLGILFDKYKLENEAVAREISSIVKLLEASEYGKAAMSIAKVIENLLKVKLSGHQALKGVTTSQQGKPKKPVFADLIKCARDISLFNEEDYKYAELLRANRNKEAHEVGTQTPVNYNLSSILTGIILIAKCDSYSSN